MLYEHANFLDICGIWYMMGIMENSKLRRGVEESWTELPTHSTGIYALVWAGKIAYIGQSVNIFSRLADHRRRLDRWRRGRVMKVTDSPLIQFDRVFVRFCPKEELDTLEWAMINKYRPEGNKALKIELEGFNFSLDEVGLGTWKKPKPSSKSQPNYLRR